MDQHASHGEHSHRHGAGCGHPASQHGDHTDYEHDGHRHRAHAEHWDECSIRTMPAGDQIDPHRGMTEPEEMRTSTGS